MSIFWREIRLVLDIEHLTSDREIIGLFHVVLIAYWGIATLLEVLTLRLDFLFVITAFDGLWSYWHLGFSLLGILGLSLISPYLSFHTQTFHHGYFHTFYHTGAWPSPSFILHILPWHMTSPLSRLWGDVDQSSITLVVLSYIFWTLGSTSSMMTGPNRLLTYQWRCFHFDSWHVECWFAYSFPFEHWSSLLLLFIS